MTLATAAVVPCKNEIRTIERCLAALRAQAEPPVLVVVVDNGSTDGSLEVARALADDVLEVGRGGIAHLRNAGAAHAVARADADGTTVEAIAFVDADTEVGDGWLDAARDVLASGADLAGARTDADPDGTWVARRWAALEAATAHDASLAWSQHLLVRRSAFDALGGFDESLATGEDSDLSLRLRAAGGEVRLDPRMRAVHHGFPSGVRQFVRRERWHTRTPGWFARMSGRSRALVVAGGVWGVAGAAATRSPRALGAWVVASALAVPALGRVALRDGGTRTPLETTQDGVLLGLWTAVRVARLPREAAAAARTTRRPQESTR